MVAVTPGQSTCTEWESTRRKSFRLVAVTSRSDGSFGCPVVGPRVVRVFLWNGRPYANKQVEAYAVDEDGWLVITVMVKFF